MSDHEYTQDKTEQPTPRKLAKSREQGQVVRSRELSTAVILMGGGLALLGLGHFMVDKLSANMYHAFTMERSAIYDDNFVLSFLLGALGQLLTALAPFCLIILALTLIGGILVGGWIFSVEALHFRSDKLNPIKGLKRMFSMHALIELAKALAKFILIALIGCFVIYLQFPYLVELGEQSPNQAIYRALMITMLSFLLVGSGMILVGLFDVPYQVWRHLKQLMMTKQELKDELKETEGRPEVRGKLRTLQQKFSSSRMLEQIQSADVIVTNLTHHSVAIRYDVSNSGAPIVVAKGQDLIAMKIREAGQQHSVPMASTPPLARALYYSCELEQEVPEGLYVAVAQVLAYVYQLNEYQSGKTTDKPTLADNLPIPDEYQRP